MSNQIYEIYENLVNRKRAHVNFEYKYNERKGPSNHHLKTVI